jgi:DNA-binding beta-propeller fold protein YncE
MKRIGGWLFALAAMGIAWLAITENGEGPGDWERWTHHAVVQASDAALHKIDAFDLPGPPGKRFDYLTIVPQRHLLLSTHLGAGRLYAIDLASNKVLNTIEDLPGIEAVEVAADLDKAYTSDWGEHKVGVIDLKQMRILKKIPVEDKPDGIAYAAPFHKMYVSDERARAEVVIDVLRDKIVKTIRFHGETGMPQYDSIAKKVLVNLQDLNLLAVIDPATDTVVGQYPVGDCRGNHGMVVDAQQRRAFLSCEENNRMTVFNLDTNKPVVSLPMARGADVIKFDPGLRRIYVACGSGAISVFQQDDPDHYRKLPDVAVEPKVHSLVVDPETHYVYAPEQQEGGQAVARMTVYAAGAEKPAETGVPHP